MAHQCPRCGQPVQLGYSGTAQITAGLVGALFYAAFGAFQCKKCGKIPRSEFPPEVRNKMTMMSLVLVASAVAIGGVILYFLSNSK